jgi:hypothetical protein
MTDGIWKLKSPAHARVLLALRNQAPVSLPTSYFEQLAISNGGEGDLGLEPGWIQFWPAESVLELNADYRISELLPGLCGFGSSGGGELLAFDARSGEPYPIVAVPFVPMELEDVVQIAESFDELRRQLGKRSKSGSA